MTEYVLHNKVRRILLCILLVGVLLSYALPWFNVNILEKPAASISGYNFLIGKDSVSLGNDILDTKYQAADLEKLGVKSEKIIPITTSAYFAIICIIIALVGSFSKNRSGPITSSVSSFIGLIFIAFATMSNPVISYVQYKGMADPFITVTGSYGFRIVILLNIFAVLMGIIAAIGKHKPEFDKTELQKTRTQNNGLY